MLVKDGLGLIFMRKVLIIIFLLLVGFITVGFYLFKDNKNQQAVKNSDSTNKAKGVNDFILQQDSEAKKNKTSSNENKNRRVMLDGFMNEKRFDEIIKNGEKNGVVYMSLNTLEPKEKADVEKAIENLEKKGSLSGGIKLKEFSELDKARKILNQEGLDNMLAKLSGFKSIPDSILNEYNMKVTGTQNFGSYHQDTGWSGMYKLYENSNQKVEVEQIYLKPNESSQMIISESLNALLFNETPAT